MRAIVESVIKRVENQKSMDKHSIQCSRHVT